MMSMIVPQRDPSYQVSNKVFGVMGRLSFRDILPIVVLDVTRPRK